VLALAQDGRSASEPAKSKARKLESSVKRARHCAASLVLALVVLSGLAFAARETSAQGGPEPPVSLLTSFDYFWRRYLLALSSGDSDTANRMLDEIRRLRVERNAFQLHDLGMCFTYQGFAHLDGGNLEEARKNFDLARELAPDLPTAYWGLARLSARQGILSYPSSIVYRIHAQLRALQSERDGPFAGWNLLFILSSTFAASFFIYGLVMLHRYGILVFHDLEERLGASFGPRTILAATLAILLLPLMLTAGLGWLAPFWLAVTFGYQTARERVVSVLGLLLLLAAAPFVELYAGWAKATSNPLYQAALSSVTGSFDPADVTLLRQAAREHPADHDLQFLLATQYKNLGDYELAATQYRRILDAYPDDLDARMNLGNIYFAQLDWEGALVQYNQVLGRDATKARAYYNKSLAHAENFQFAEREEARLRAESLDAAGMAAHERRTGDYRVVEDTRLDSMEILSKFYGLPQGIDDASARGNLGLSLFGGWGLRFLVAPILFGALIFGLEYAFKDRKLTQRCRKCGSPFCGRCQIGTGRKGLCTQCYHLFFMKDGVSASARNDKLTQVQRATRTRSLLFRVLSIVAPGAGHVSEGMPLVGILLLLVWVLGVLAIALRGSLYALPDGLLGFGAGFPLVLLAMMAASLAAANFLVRPGRGRA
jgi:tetratricopeptide (TPR) repeat protein